MKHGNNNEVDLLLRSLARGRNGAAWQKEDGETVSSPHLDADELNSYAEGVSPESARARYTEHLARCESCRGIVVSLTQAAGTASRFETAEQKGAGFWQKISEFFSPKVLGFAVPALVLAAVIGISFLAYRKRSETQLVAQSERPASTSPTTQGNTDSKLNSAAQPQPTIQNGTTAVTTTDRAKSGSVLHDDKQQAGREALKPDSAVAKAGPEKDSGQPVDTASAVAPRPYATEPKTEAAPPPAVMREAEKSAELAKEQPVGRAEQTRDQDEVSRAQSDDVHGPNRSRNNTSLPGNQRSAGIVGGRASSGMDKNKKAGEADTRAVMGRQFIREGGAWVDTAYDTSRATVRVTRGSDQFRALVADEPGLRTISEQLNGVVIVVWKNRAYRIQ